MRHRLPVIRIFDVPVVQATENEAISEIAHLAKQDEPAMVAYVNAHTLELAARDSEFKKVLLNGAIVFNDGIGISIAAALMRKPSFPANLNGTDLTPRILELASEKGWRVFVLGAAAGIAEIAAKKLVEVNSQLQFSGTHTGYFEEDCNREIVKKIRDSNTDVLLVGMGNPRQEKWLDCHLKETGCKLGIGVGAFIDFSAGIFPRAPMWMQSMKIEWLYRMYREPFRLFKRYLLGGPLFLVRVVLDSLKIPPA